MARFAPPQIIFFFFCFATFSLFNSCLAAKIVLMPMFGDSHYFMIQRIAEELGNRGHQVTILIGSQQKYRPNEKYETLTFKAYLNSAIREEDLDSEIQDNRSLLKMIGNMGGNLPYIQLMQCESLFNNTNKVILEKLRGTHLVVADGVDFCPLLLAEYLDALRIDFVPGSLISAFTDIYYNPSPMSYVPAIRAGSTDEMNFMERLKNVVFWFIYYCRGRYKFYYSGLDAMKTKHNIKPEISATESKQNAELVLFANDFALDIPQPLNPGMKVVGPLLPKPASPLPEKFERFVSSSGKTGIVLVSFGSMMSSPTQDVVETFAKAFGRLKQKVIWKIDAKFAASLSPNVMAVDWFPQNDLLGHPQTRAFVSHVGINSLHEAAYHGVPMVGIPLWGDQHENAIRMARAGMGLWMQVYSFTSDELYEAIHKVIKVKSFKANATRISRILKDRPQTGAQEAADWVEYVLRHGGAKHLRPKVFDITWYQYYLLDVALFVVAILFVAIIVVQILCRCICGICKDKTKNKTD